MNNIALTAMKKMLIQLNLKSVIDKILLTGIIFILSNGCCLEQSHEIIWKITNNSSDTLYIKFPYSLYPDSAIVLPKTTSDIIDGGLGNDETFYCSRIFEDKLTKVNVSGNKNLKKALNNNENWVQNSDNGSCSTNFACYFEINQIDIE